MPIPESHIARDWLNTPQLSQEAASNIFVADSLSAEICALTEAIHMLIGEMRAARQPKLGLIKTKAVNET